MSPTRTLTSGHGLVESPRWHGGRLWFSDWIAGTVLAVDPATGVLDVVVEHASLPLCFDFLPDGRVVLVSNQDHALLTQEADGTLTSYADLSGVSPDRFNDIVVDGRGYAYVNGFRPGGASDAGIVVLVRPDGEPQVVAEGLEFPNGMAVTADGATLVVAESHGHRLAGYDLRADGSLGAWRVWADLGDAAPDGICIDADGAAWYADVPDRRCVRVAEGGAVLDTVDLDRGAFACMLDDDGPTLYVVGAHWHGFDSLTQDVDWDGTVFSVPVAVPGAGWPAR